MMQQLRIPVFLAAFSAVLLVIFLELGATVILGGGESGPPVDIAAAKDLLEAIGIDQTEGLQEVDPVSSQGNRPGRGISYLAFVDGILVFTLSLIAVSLLVRERVQGRVQGIATFIFSLILVTTAVVMITTAVTELTVMVSLLLSPPFGTSIYMARYASFDRAGAAVVLSILMALKFAFVVLLILAQQRFLQNKGLIFLIITSFIATLIVSFLHGLVPTFLVSITDLIAAIIVAGLAALWGIVLLLGSIKSVSKAVGIPV
jgi:hypothetical protein